MIFGLLLLLQLWYDYYSILLFYVSFNKSNTSRDRLIPLGDLNMEKPNEKSKYLTLFTSTFTLSAFTFGGGYVIVPLMKKRFVEELKWIDNDEMLDMIAIAQSSPGAIAVNSSILIGYKIAGVPGALITVLGTVTPPLIIISIISLFYEAFRDNAMISTMLRTMQAGVAAIIIDVVLSMASVLVKNKKVIPLVMMALSFLATVVFDINLIFILLINAIVGALQFDKKKKEVEI